MAASRVLEKSDVVRLLRLLNDLHDAPDGADARWRTLLGGVCGLAGATGGVIAMRPRGGDWTVTHRHGLDASAATQLTRAGDAPDAGRAQASSATDRHDPALRRLHRQGRTLRAGATLTRTRRELID